MRENFQPCVYLLASHRNGTLYVGVTSDLIQRIHQHREGLIEGFAKGYGVQRWSGLSSTPRWSWRLRVRSGSRSGIGRGRSG